VYEKPRYFSYFLFLKLENFGGKFEKISSEKRPRTLKQKKEQRAYIIAAIAGAMAS
jgi:hypothetical protein